MATKGSIYWRRLPGLLGHLFLLLSITETASSIEHPSSFSLPKHQTPPHLADITPGTMASKAEFERVAHEVIRMLRRLPEYSDVRIAVIGGLAVWDHLPNYNRERAQARKCRPLSELPRLISSPIRISTLSWTPPPLRTTLNGSYCFFPTLPSPSQRKCSTIIMERHSSKSTSSTEHL